MDVSYLSSIRILINKNYTWFLYMLISSCLSVFCVQGWPFQEHHVKLSKYPTSGKFSNKFLNISQKHAVSNHLEKPFKYLLVTKTNTPNSNSIRK